jgi:hypothetical protein
MQCSLVNVYAGCFTSRNFKCHGVVPQAEMAGEIIKVVAENGKPITTGQVSSAFVNLTVSVNS